jgi:23S rRNA (cytosine1962-C5)-methyltransferase
MDPPAFGRGPKGEVWKIEESLSELLALISKLLSPKAKLVILNGYASGYSARTFGELLGESLKNKKGLIIYGDIGIEHKNDNRILTTGIYACLRI